MADNGNGRDYVHPTAVTAWQLIGAVLTVVTLFVASMWVVITNEQSRDSDMVKEYRAIDHDLRDELKAFVTQREHHDLTARLDREIKRMDETIPGLMTDRVFKAWEGERDKAFTKLVNDMEYIRQHSISQREFDSVINERSQQIEALRQSIRREIDALRHEFNSRERVEEDRRGQ